MEAKITIPDNIAERRPWDYRFQQLVAYKEENGHCIVPQITPELGVWVKTQRSDYRKFTNGQKSGLTEERIERLKSIGFVFHAGRGGGARRHELNRISEEKSTINSDSSEIDDEEEVDDEIEEEDAQAAARNSLRYQISQHFLTQEQTRTPLQQGTPQFASWNRYYTSL